MYDPIDSGDEFRTYIKWRTSCGEPFVARLERYSDQEAGFDLVRGDDFFDTQRTALYSNVNREAAIALIDGLTKAFNITPGELA